jgi:hypothetical protein
MFHTKVVQKIKTHILCSVTFFFENRTVYGIMENIVERGRPEMAICALQAGYLRLQTHAHNIRYILLFHGNNGYANAPQWCVYRHIACLLLSLLGKIDRKNPICLSLRWESIWHLLLVTVSLSAWQWTVGSGKVTDDRAVLSWKFIARRSGRGNSCRISVH